MKLSRLLTAFACLVVAGLVTPQTQAASTTRMSIQLLGPAGQVTVNENGKIPIRVHITGLKLNASAMGRSNVPGEGHYHFYVDCIPPAAYTQMNNFGNCWAGAVASTTTSFDLATSHVKIAPGQHVLFLALAHNDHVLYPAAPAALVFRVVKPSVSIRLLSPLRPVTVPLDGKISIHVKVTGVSLNAKAMGRKNIAGQGHYHFYVDCLPPAAYTQMNNFGNCWAGAVASEHSVFDLSTSHVKIHAGTHVLLIALARNDHILYRAPVQTVVFTVTSAR